MQLAGKLYQSETPQKSAGQELVPQAVVTGSSISVHTLVPLQVRLVQSSLVHVIAVPEQIPKLQVSPQVQLSPSLQSAEILHSQVPPEFVQM